MRKSRVLTQFALKSKGVLVVMLSTWHLRLPLIAIFVTPIEEPDRQINLPRATKHFNNLVSLLRDCPQVSHIARGALPVSTKRYSELRKSGDACPFDKYVQQP